VGGRGGGGGGGGAACGGGPLPCRPASPRSTSASPRVSCRAFLSDWVRYRAAEPTHDARRGLPARPSCAHAWNETWPACSGCSRCGPHAPRTPPPSPPAPLSLVPDLREFPPPPLALP